MNVYMYRSHSCRQEKTQSTSYIRVWIGENNRSQAGDAEFPLHQFVCAKLQLLFWSQSQKALCLFCCRDEMKSHVLKILEDISYMSKTSNMLHSHLVLTPLLRSAPPARPPHQLSAPLHTKKKQTCQNKNSCCHHEVKQSLEHGLPGFSIV